MAEDNILLLMSIYKNELIREFMHDFLGHPPSPLERKQFTIVHSLHETNIYFMGRHLTRIPGVTHQEKIA
jgi:hypothetical protein